MAISVADNFSYLGGKPLDSRIQYATVADMKAMADAKLYEGCEAYCVATDKYYKWKSTNTVDTTLGKWREIESGGSGLPSGGTTGQYLVKQSATEGDADWQSLSAFTGATSQAAGAAGLVPAPASGDEGKVLFGDGSWGNIVMPSVDYSQQSVEANIYSTTEKVVGQWKNGKLVYQKTLEFVNDGSWTLDSDGRVTFLHGISNIDEIIYAIGYRKQATASVFINDSTTNGFYTWLNTITTTDIRFKLMSDTSASTTPSIIVTMQYTKTTDSPLASGEKFAGLLSSGSVVYKKTVSTGGSVPSGATLIYRLALLNGTDVVYYTKTS